jgi:hypothetical protein
VTTLPLPLPLPNKNYFNENLHNLYASPNIIRVIQIRMVRWAGHVTRMAKIRNAYNIRKTKRTDNLGDLGIDGRIILRSILSRI